MRCIALQTDSTKKLSEQQRRLLWYIALNEGRVDINKERSVLQLEGVFNHRKRGTLWNAAYFIGDNATQSQRNTVNAALAALERRGLVKRYKGAQGKRTKRVRLTREGYKVVKTLTTVWAKEHGFFIKTIVK